MEYVSWFATARISNFSHTQLLNFHLHVCVFLWFELNFGTHTHSHTHTYRRAWKILQQTTKGLSGWRRRRGRLCGGGGRCNVSSIVTNVVAQRPLPTTPPPPFLSPFCSPRCRSITFCFSTFGSLCQSFVILVVVVADIVIVVVAGQACTIYTHESPSVCVCVCHTHVCPYVQSSVSCVHIICIASCVRVCMSVRMSVRVYECACVCACV